MSDQLRPVRQWVDLRLRIQHPGPGLLTDDEILSSCEVQIDRSDWTLMSVDVAPPRPQPPSIGRQFVTVGTVLGELALAAVLVVAVLGFAWGLFLAGRGIFD